MVGFKEIYSTFNRVVLTAFSRRFGSPPNASGIPVLIDIKENKALVSIIKNPQHGGGNNNMVPAVG